MTDKQIKEVIKETVDRYNFISNYNPSKPEGYKKLREIKGDDKTVFTHDVLLEMREGKLDKKHPIFEILHNVKDILLTEVFNSFSEFMSKLKTDKNSLMDPNNEIRRVYEGFKSGTPQHWNLIDPDEYLRCIQQYTQFHKPLSSAVDSYWAPRVIDWVVRAEENVLQLAANSYLTSGPTLDPESENSQGQNLHALLWYHLTGDEEIPYRPGQCGNDSLAEREFFNKYWRPFTKYIQTKYGEGAESSETDSPLDGLFNIVAAFYKDNSNPQKLFIALDRLIHICHDRGTLAHLFMKGGNAACTKISNS